MFVANTKPRLEYILDSFYLLFNPEQLSTDFREVILRRLGNLIACNFYPGADFGLFF